MRTIRPTRRAAPPDLKRRLTILRNRLAQLNTPALLVTNPRDIRYLTGFIGDDSWALVTAKNARVHVLSDFRFEQEIARNAPHVVAHIRTGPIHEALAELARTFRVSRLGLQSDHVSIALRSRLAKALGAKALSPIDDGLLTQRAVKDAGELSAVRKALAIQQEAFRRLIPAVRPGVREHELAAELEYHMRRLGADGASFPTIIAADANASLPHAVPGTRKVRSGGIVLIDWGARFAGYCSDLTRTLALGKMPARIREIYSVVLEAQAAAVAAVAPGKSVQDIDAAARKVIEKAGFVDRFGHGTGHGIGLDIHELPTLSPRGEGTLEAGQIITVEPGIYLPGVGGVRIEDDVLVTARGGKFLSDLPRDLDSAII